MSLILSAAGAAALLGAAQPEPTVTLPTFGAPLPTPVLAAMAQEDEDGLNEWNGSFTLGATVTAGNTEITQLNADFDAEYRREKDRTTLEAYWTYADETDTITDESSVTQRQVYGKGQYDYFFEEDLYGYGNVTGLYDFQAALDLRLTIGVGAGKQWIDEADHAFSTEIGISFVDEDFVLDADDTDYAAARGAFSYRKELSEDTTFEQDGEILVSLDDTDDKVATLDTRLRTNLTETMFGALQWIMQWDETPATGLKQTDHRIVLSIGWTF